MVIVFRRLSFLLLGILALIGTACSGGGSSAPTADNAGNPALGRLISGVVTDPANAPVGGVTVTLTGTASGSTTTSVDGKYSFTGLPIGTYAVSASGGSYIFGPSGYAGISTANNFYTTGVNFTVDSVLVSGVVTTVVVPGDAGVPDPIPGVTVTAHTNGHPDIVVTTDAGGNYQLPLINGASYTITYKMVDSLIPLVLPATYYYTVDIFNTSLETVRLLRTVPASIADPTVQADPPPGAPGNGSASGTVVNAFDGLPAPNLTVELRPGINAPDSVAVTTTTTTLNDGTYSFANVPAGYYTCKVSGQIINTGVPALPVTIVPSYFTVTIVKGRNFVQEDNGVTGGLQAGQYRIILTWGSAPSDLDSHLTGPAVPGDASQTGGRFHVYWVANKRNYTFNNIKYADLDLDDTTSFGPETTTIYTQLPGTYRFSVHNFSGTPSLAGCGAKVKVYKGSSLLRTFNVPAIGSGNVWTVFELSGDTITPKNVLKQVSDYNTIP